MNKTELMDSLAAAGRVAVVDGETTVISLDKDVLRIRLGLNDHWNGPLVLSITEVSGDVVTDDGARMNWRRVEEMPIEDAVRAQRYLCALAEAVCLDSLMGDRSVLSMLDEARGEDFAAFDEDRWIWRLNWVPDRNVKAPKRQRIH